MDTIDTISVGILDRFTERYDIIFISLKEDEGFEHGCRQTAGSNLCLPVGTPDHQEDEGAEFPKSRHQDMAGSSSIPRKWDRPPNGWQGPHVTCLVQQNSWRVRLSPTRNNHLWLRSTIG